MDLFDAAAFHSLSLKAEGRSPRTLQTYLYHQRLFLDFLHERHMESTLEALSPLNVRHAVEWLRQRPARGSRGGAVQVQMFVTVVKLWASFLEAEGVFVDSPLRKLRPVKVPKVLREPFSQQEVMALWSASRQGRTARRDEALLLLLLDTGIRVGEATSLTVDKLRLEDRHIVVGLAGKGRRERLVPIGDQAKLGGGRTLTALRAYLRQRAAFLERFPQRATARVFLTWQGFPLATAGAQDVLRRIGRDAGVSNVHPHRCRHTFATWYLTVNPGDELGLRRILGHLSRDVLADYAHLSQTTIADRAGRSSLVESLATPAVALRPARALQSKPVVEAWGSRYALPEPPLTPVQRAEQLLAGVSPDLRRELTSLIAELGGRADRPQRSA